MFLTVLRGMAASLLSPSGSKTLDFRTFYRVFRATGAGEDVDARKAAHKEASTSGQAASGNGAAPEQVLQRESIDKAAHMTSEVRTSPNKLMKLT